MKRIACLVVACAAITLMGLTEKQATVAPALETLKLEKVPSDVIGGPMSYKVTKKTIEHLEHLMKEGKVLVLENDGALKVK